MKEVWKMWETVALGIWLSFVTYVLWYMFRAKELQPLTLDDLALLWRIHKHQTRCTASRLRELLIKNNNVVGFKCECGHHYLQKRLITQRIHPQLQTAKPLSVNELEESVQKIVGTRPDLHLRYLNIRRI
jgi:hypothetical protein